MSEFGKVTNESLYHDPQPGPHPSDMSFQQIQRPEMEEQIQLLPTEILNNIILDPRRPHELYPDYDSYVRAQIASLRMAAERIHVGERRSVKNSPSTVFPFFWGGPPGTGKTDAASQALLKIREELTDSVELELTPGQVKNTRTTVEFYTIAQADAVRTYRDITGRWREFGQYKSGGLHAITRMTERAFETLRLGPSHTSGRDGKGVIITSVDSPLCTATDLKNRLTGRPHYFGYDRMYTFLQHLLKNREIGKNVFVTLLLADEDSIFRRLALREMLPLVQTKEAVVRYFTQAKMKIDPSQLTEKFIAYMPYSAASLGAAMIVWQQTGELILSLHERREIELSTGELITIRSFIASLASYIPLTDEKHYRGLLNAVIQIMGEYLYPHILNSLGINPANAVIAWNNDVADNEGVHHYPTHTGENNLLDQIKMVSPQVLKP